MVYLAWRTKAHISQKFCLGYEINLTGINVHTSHYRAPTLFGALAMFLQENKHQLGTCSHVMNGTR